METKDFYFPFEETEAKSREQVSGGAADGRFSREEEGFSHVSEQKDTACVF